MLDHPETIDGLQAAFSDRDYVADRALVTSVFLGLKLGRPLLLVGEAGVG
jgi:MoxR-like ATPase